MGAVEFTPDVERADDWGMEMIRTVCAWCAAVIVDVPAVGPVSHGCCRACCDKLLAEVLR